MKSFTNEPLHEKDVVVYLKTTRTGSSTVRKCLYVGEIIGFTKQKVKINRLSPMDTFVTPDEVKDYGVDVIAPEGIVNILINYKKMNDGNNGLYKITNVDYGTIEKSSDSNSTNDVSGRIIVAK